MIPQVTEN